MSKGRYGYPTTVTSAYILILEWNSKPGSIQGGSIKRYNNMVFAQNNNQGYCKRTGKIYKNITCYNSIQLSHYNGSYPFKEEEQEKLKHIGIIQDNIVQGINFATTGISSMHVEHKVDESNRET